MNNLLGAESHEPTRPRGGRQFEGRDLFESRRGGCLAVDRDLERVGRAILGFSQSQRPWPASLPSSCAATRPALSTRRCSSSRTNRPGTPSLAREAVFPGLFVRELEQRRVLNAGSVAAQELGKTLAIGAGLQAQNGTPDTFQVSVNGQASATAQLEQILGPQTAGHHGAKRDARSIPRRRHVDRDRRFVRGQYLDHVVARRIACLGRPA